MVVFGAVVRQPDDGAGNPSFELHLLLIHCTSSSPCSCYEQVGGE